MRFSDVSITLPSASLFKFPPAPEPAVVPPPTAPFPRVPLFNIPEDVYNHLLSPAYPITIAAVYLSTVILLNGYNRSRDGRAWSVSKSQLFRFGVIVHNLFLAIYSGWTCLGMINAVAQSWPGLDGPDGIVGVVDQMCKMHGPRGLGQAVAFNSTTNQWRASSPSVNLLASKAGIPGPDTTDVGRFWNEGLAFYGWLFYVSKFYEVVDTLIVLAKGKQSSFLQTYHHAGAMISVWAGIRYMSPPIWLFVLLNSGIHAFMYTYYTVTALSVPVPVAVKRVITTLQITQMVVGTSYAILHLFVSYRAPFTSPETFVSPVASAASSVAATATASAATAGGSVGNWLKKFALRAAGEEGLAENVPGGDMHVLGNAAHDAANAAGELKYSTVYATTPCIDTSGESFAIWLNVLYLAPLTYLFVRFFTKSYSARAGASKPAARGIKAGRDAVKGVDLGVNESVVGEKSK